MISVEGFLDLIRQDPDQDCNRLIFADWLEDQSNPDLLGRGRLIRLQSLLAEWEPSLEKRNAYLEEERKLLEENGGYWLGRLGEYRDQCAWIRGFARLTLPAKRFNGRRFAFLAAEEFPNLWIDTLVLEQLSAALPQILSAEALRYVPRLDLSRNLLTSEELGEFLRSPHLSSLYQLDLSNNRLGNLSVSLLVRAAEEGRLAGLRVLDLRNNQLEEEAIEALLASRLANQLKKLEIMGNPCRNLLALKLRIREMMPPVLEKWLGKTRWVMNSIGMEFGLIPAGEFMMGATPDEAGSEAHERPVHQVTISRPYYLGLHTVTQEQYQRVMGENPSHFRHLKTSPGQPVENISWEMAEEFCFRLSDLVSERSEGNVYRLPTEAEWEHAARAGIQGEPFHFGRSLSSTLANFNGQNPYGDASRGPFLERTALPGSFPQNPWGLYDIHGNVWEWCRDWFAEDYYSTGAIVDPVGPSAGERKVLRGGSWLNQGINCRSACRDRFSPDFRYKDNGLRVVLEVR